MIIVNKYNQELRAIIVGMETDLPVIEWQRPVVTATEKESWLKEKLNTVESILMKLLQRECYICISSLA